MHYDNDNDDDYKNPIVVMKTVRYAIYRVGQHGLGSHTSFSFIL